MAAEGFSGFSSWVLGERDRMNAAHERHRVRLMQPSVVPYPFGKNEVRCVSAEAVGNMRRLREEGLSQERVAVLTGTSQTSVSRYEASGFEPRKTIAQRIAEKRAREASHATT